MSSNVTKTKDLHLTQVLQNIYIIYTLYIYILIVHKSADGLEILTWDTEKEDSFQKVLSIFPLKKNILVCYWNNVCPHHG